MKLVIQRVRKASVKAGDKIVGKIDKGLFILVGIKRGDAVEKADALAKKLLKLRIMSDENDKMNLSIQDTNDSLLVVSQFTLYANTKEGNRPSFIKAAEPSDAKKIYEYFVQKLKESRLNVATGSFGNYMTISTVLDGPVTLEIKN